MTKIAVVYYSAFGHVASMSKAVLEGIERVEGVEGMIYKMPGISAPEFRPINQKEENQTQGVVADRFKLTKRNEKFENSQVEQQSVPIVTLEDLRRADAVIWGFPTYLGTMPGQVKLFIDRVGHFCSTGEMEGKPTAVFTSAGSIHGGHEAAILTSIVPLLHLGMIFLGLPYTENPEYLTDEAIGCSPYGASTLAGPDGSRQPVEAELVMAARLGERVAKVATAFKVTKPFG